MNVYLMKRRHNPLKKENYKLFWKFESYFLHSFSETWKLPLRFLKYFFSNFSRLEKVSELFFLFFFFLSIRIVGSFSAQFRAQILK